MFFDSGIIELAEEVREKLKIEMERVLAEHKKSQMIEVFSEHTPIKQSNNSATYYLKEIFEKVLGIKCEQYHGEYDYFNYDGTGVYGFKIGMQDIVCVPGKTLAGLCEETTDAFVSEYVRKTVQALHMADVFFNGEGELILWSLLSAVADKKYKDVLTILSKEQYYDEEFKNVLISNGYYVATGCYAEKYDIPYISLEDSLGNSCEIPLYKLIDMQGEVTVCPRTCFEIIMCIRSKKLMVLEDMGPSKKVIKEQMDLHKEIKYKGYSPKEIEELSELGKEFTEPSELKVELGKRGYDASDVETMRIVLCGSKFKEGQDFTPRTWYRFGCPFLLEDGRYLPSFNPFSKKREHGVAVVTTKLLSQIELFIREKSFENMGVWKIRGIQIGNQPMIHPLGLAEKTSISTLGELWEAIKEAEQEPGAVIQGKEV